MGQSMVAPVSTSLVRLSEFGPFHAIVFQAHQLYLEGFFDRAVLACREGMLVTVGAGDRVTSQFLRYVEGITLQEGGRHHEAVTVALDLLADVEDDPDPMWRAKALALLAESSTQVGEVSRAMDALAEGAWLVAHTEPDRYSHLSASTAVAVALRAVFLFEQADELLAGIKLGDDIDVDLQVVQERALLGAFWGTTLLVVGHDREAGPHLVTTAEQALSMGRIAELAGNSEMTARAEIIEAYALSRLGYADLAAARVKATTQRFRLRDELVETHSPASSSDRQRRSRVTSSKRAGTCWPLWGTPIVRAATCGRPLRWRRWPTWTWLSTGRIRRSNCGNVWPERASSGCGSNATADSPRCSRATRCAR